MSEEEISYRHKEIILNILELPINPREVQKVAFQKGLIKIERGNISYSLPEKAYRNWILDEIYKLLKDISGIHFLEIAERSWKTPRLIKLYDILLNSSRKERIKVINTVEANETLNRILNYLKGSKLHGELTKTDIPSLDLLYELMMDLPEKGVSANLLQYSLEKGKKLGMKEKFAYVTPQKYKEGLTDISSLF